MLRYDHCPSHHRDAIAQRQAMLDTIVGYRFFAPHKIAADERRQQAVERAALSQAAGPSTGVSWRWLAPLRRRLGVALVDVGTRLQGHAAASLDPQPES